MPNPQLGNFDRLPVGKECLTDKNGNEYNSTNPLPTTATISGDVNVDQTALDGMSLVGKSSGGDFVTAYGSATTITTSGLPSYHSTLLDDDIVIIVQIATAGSVTNIYTRDDATITVAAGTITVTGATFVNTDAFVVYTNIAREIAINEFPTAAALADNTANPTTTLVGSCLMSYDGATWNLVRGTSTGGLWMQGAVAHDAADNGNPAKIGYYAVDPTSLPTAVSAADRVNGIGSLQGEILTYDSRLAAGEDQANNVSAICNKPLATSTYAYSIDQSAALEASTVTKAASGVIYGIEGRIDSTHGTATYYIQFINAASLPADGAVTMLKSPYKIQHTNGTDSKFTFDFGQGIYASTGIVICLSTTEFTKTISGAFYSGTVYYA
jgi:hypothetical protein